MNNVSFKFNSIWLDVFEHIFFELTKPRLLLVRRSCMSILGHTTSAH